jgi:hypothetical protein
MDAQEKLFALPDEGAASTVRNYALKCADASVQRDQGQSLNIADVTH